MAVSLLPAVGPAWEASTSRGSDAAGAPAWLAGDPHRQRLDPAQEVRVGTLRRAHHLDREVTLEDLVPQDLQLDLGQPVTHAAMNARAERKVVPRPGPVDHEALRIVDDLLVAVAGDVPHDDLVASADSLAAQLGVHAGGAAHVDDGRLPTDRFLHERRQDLDRKSVV